MTDASSRPLTVTQLARRIVRLLEGEIGVVTVTGEVSNLRRPSSGHCYFILKDAEAAINAVCFRSTLQRQRVSPANGMQLEIRGRLSAYAPRSEYQIIIESIREAGLGDLMRRFIELRDKLKDEGLFDTARKRPIPRLPRRIGLVTSSTGAALRDMINVLNRRARGLTIYLSPASVQGDAAPADIVRAINRLCRHGQAEVVLVGRGGGSIEDLWAFNDERVVRAIAGCSLPVICCVGHETDTTLADYAADLRAPTPSAAAELVTAHYGELLQNLEQTQRRLARTMQYQLADWRARLQRCLGSWGLRHPRERLAVAMQRADDLSEQLNLAMLRNLHRREQQLDDLACRLGRVNPLRRVEALRVRLQRSQSLLLAIGPSRWGPQLAASSRLLEQFRQRLRVAMESRLHRRGLELQGTHQRLLSVSPTAILQRGYSIVTHGKRRQIVKDPGQVKINETIYIQSAQGPWRAAALPPDEDLFDQ